MEMERTRVGGDMLCVYNRAGVSTLVPENKTTKTKLKIANKDTTF